MTDLSPTTAATREEWSGTDWCLDWNSEPPGEDVSHECYKAQPNECANEVIDRLIADVNRLGRQLGDELAADSVLCPHAPNHILEAKCKELEPLAYRCEAHQDEVAGCPCCDAVKIADLEADLETEVERLEEQNKTIKLCRSYASNTGGGMDAEYRLRRILELCCCDPEAPYA